MEHKELSFQEFEKPFKTLKWNKAIGYDDLSGNIVIDVYDSIKVALFKIFKESIEEAFFPEKLKIAKVIPVFKGWWGKYWKLPTNFYSSSFFQSAWTCYV